MAERIIDATSYAFDLGEHQVFVSTSIGIAIFPNHGTEPETLLKNADTAMYHAKRLGKNNAQFFDERLEQHAVERLTLASDLRQAVTHGALCLHFQPQLDVLTSEVFGVEALLRWHHRTLGAVSPATFVPIAEETGLIVPIGGWVLRAACAQGRQWIEQGIGPLRVAVNVSGVQLRRDDFVKHVEAALDGTQFPPELLELEITEMAAVMDVTQTSTNLKRLRDLGIRIAIDDFGTGYATLAYLKDFPVDLVKIDRSFIRNIAESPSDAAMVRAMLALARSMGLEALAEGVESEQQLKIVRAAGCRAYQGFFASPPLAPEDFAPWLIDWQQRLVSAEPVLARA